MKNYKIINGLTCIQQGYFALTGGFVGIYEDLDIAVDGVLKERAMKDNIFPEHIFAFDSMNG